MISALKYVMDPIFCRSCCQYGVMLDRVYQRRYSVHYLTGLFVSLNSNILSHMHIVLELTTITQAYEYKCAHRRPVSEHKPFSTHGWPRSQPMRDYYLCNLISHRLRICFIISRKRVQICLAFSYILLANYATLIMITDSEMLLNYNISQGTFMVLHMINTKTMWLHRHYSGVIMGAMASEITSLMIVYSTVYSGASLK